MQWLTRTDNLKKRDEAGSLNKSTYVYDNVTGKVTEYESRLQAAEALSTSSSSLVYNLKKENVIRGRYFVTDEDYLLPEDYYIIFKEVELRKELKKTKQQKQEIILNRIKEVSPEASVANGMKNLNKVGR